MHKLALSLLLEFAVKRRLKGCLGSEVAANLRPGSVDSVCVNRRQARKNASSDTSSASGAPRHAVSADTEELSEAEPATARSCVKYTFCWLATRRSSRELALASAAALLAYAAASASLSC